MITTERPLMDLTVGEVKKICQSHQCGKCPINADGSDCLFGHIPKLWKLLPSLTENERDILRLTGAKFISRDEQGTYCGAVNLWRSRPEKRSDGTFCVALSAPNMTNINRLSAALFPSVQPGVCWEVAELLGEGEAAGEQDH